MAVEFTATLDRSYKAYLARNNLRANIEVVFMPDVRALIGPVSEIFHGGKAAGGAVRDFRVTFDRANNRIEVAVLNLWAVSEQLSPLEADVVMAFQALFVKQDEIEQALSNLRRDAGVPAADDEAYAAALAFLSRQEFAQALAALPQPGECSEHGGSAAYYVELLRGRLLAGIPGQPKSTEHLNLAAAEAAFVAAARAADPPDGTDAVAALTAAGKMAYAQGRLTYAELHYRAALALREYGEARYQLARVRVHASDMAAARSCLSTAFAAHWSYALRAASDPLFFSYALRAASDPLFFRHGAFLRRCVRAATRRVRLQAREEYAAAHAALTYLEQQQDPAIPLDRFIVLIVIRGELREIEQALPARTLQSAFDLRKRGRLVGAAISRLAADYCALLVRSENGAVMHDAQPAARRPSAAIAGSTAAFLQRLIEAAAILAAMAAFAVAGGTFGLELDLLWRKLVLNAGLGLVAIAALGALGMLRRRIFQWLDPVVAAWQERSRARERIRLEARRERNRAALHERIDNIVHRLGVVRPAPATIDRVPDATHTMADQRLAS